MMKSQLPVRPTIDDVVDQIILTTVCKDIRCKAEIYAYHRETIINLIKNNIDLFGNVRTHDLAVR